MTSFLFLTTRENRGIESHITSTDILAGRAAQYGIFDKFQCGGSR